MPKFSRKPYYRVEPSGCWTWLREIDTKGYGMYRFQGNEPYVKRAHRWVYEQHRGPIPTGLELDHLCRVKACVNPDHLEPVTHAENVRRAMTRTECRRGHPFTPENELWRKHGRTCRTCFQAANRRYYARKYGKEAA